MTSTSPAPTDAPLPRLVAWILCLLSFLLFPNKGVGLTYPLIFSPPGDAQRTRRPRHSVTPLPFTMRIVGLSSMNSYSSTVPVLGGSGRTTGRYASAARAFISPTAFEQARGQALWERVEAGSGSPGATSSESAAGSGRLRAPAAVLGFLRLLSRPRFRPSRGLAGVSLGLDGCEVRLSDP